MWFGMFNYCKCHPSTININANYAFSDVKQVEKDKMPKLVCLDSPVPFLSESVNDGVDYDVSMDEKYDI